MLTAGTTLGSYEILGLLGKGGMGEVYRARDSKLKREVAIKVLPEEFSRDHDRLSRFQREAEVLASLNHTNIAGIHDLQEANGSRFLVMELVEGETLADRITQGPLPIDEALTIARQICEALEAAHEKGIIHRDLKPANIKLLPDGKVKVLDFGLAKAFEGESANAVLSNSPTLSMAATNAGVILGTAAYMSPEQAKGRNVDKRTDIFALGCVLYEMLTGRAAFGGEDIHDILGAVLKSEPDWSRLPVGVPARIRELLKLCLEKNARNRRSDATDVRLDIEQVLREPGASTSGLARSSRVAWVALVFALIIIVALAIPAVRYLRETSPPETRVDIVTPEAADSVSFALSPDGRQIVFVGSGDGASRLWLRPLTGTSAQPMTGTEGAAYPFWSPDSHWVGFFADGELKKIEIGGGAPQTLAAATFGGTWSANDFIVFPRNNGGPLFRVAASGGEAVAVTKLDRQASHRFPFFLPGTRQFLFYAVGVPETSGIYLGSLDSPESKRLTAADSPGLYVPSGWLLFMRGETLVAQRMDLGQGVLTGNPVTVADSVVYDFRSFLGAISVSENGLIAYRTGRASQRQLAWYDRSGKVLGTVGAPDANSIGSPMLSPDGRHVALQRYVNEKSDIWMLEAARGVLSRFTSEEGGDGTPIWSPDSSRIAFQSRSNGLYDLYQKLASGTGSKELLLTTQQIKVPGDWSPDGRFLLYRSLDPKLGYDLWALPLDGEKKPFVVVQTKFDERDGQFSPDGKWIAYQSNESGRAEIYVQAFPGPGRKWGPISTNGGAQARWRHDGKELFYIALDDRLMAVPIQLASDGQAVEAGASAPLFTTHVGGALQSTSMHQYMVSPDGQRFLMNTLTGETVSPITLIQNWKPPTN